MKETLSKQIVILILAAAGLCGILLLRWHEPALAEDGTPVTAQASDLPSETPEFLPAPTLDESITPTPEETPASAPTPTPEEDSEEETDSGGATVYPDVNINSWEFLLVNKDHPIGDYVPELSYLEDGRQFDSRAVDALQAFIDGARAQGLSVLLSSAYRGGIEQDYLFRRKVEQYGGDEERAAAIVSRPGTSEHETGLCADITDTYYELKTRALENTALYQWMLAHCAEYGFILRYPEDKEDITGITYEPWHFRYVGKEAAEYIMENGLCLEEFIEMYEALYQ